MGSLDDQINLASKYSEPESVAIKDIVYEDYVESIVPADFKEGLEFYNGIGGFSKDGENYVMDISAENHRFPGPM